MSRRLKASKPEHDVVEVKKQPPGRVLCMQSQVDGKSRRLRTGATSASL